MSFTWERRATCASASASTGRTAAQVPAWIMTEPPEVFQRDVLRRHALPDQLDDQAAHPGDPTAAMERAWLARVVAAQRAGRARRDGP